jgi:hypothetical protein
MMGMSAAGQMANNAGISGYNAGQMGNLNPTVPGVTTPGTGITTPPGTVGASIDTPGSTSGIQIDDSFTRTGKAGAIFDEFEQKTGIDRDEFAKGLKDGKSVADMLAASKNFGGSSADKLQGMFDGAQAMNANDVMDKLGLTPEELAAMAGKGEGEMNLAGASSNGSGAMRNPASTGLDGLLGGLGNTPAAGDGTVGLKNGSLSPDVQAALDRNGITDRTIFQMVRMQYRSKTPMMFGQAERSRQSATGTNPFADLASPSGGKIEF